MIFDVIFDFPELVKNAIENFNNFHGTDFELIHAEDLEKPNFQISVTKFSEENIFDLGYSLAVLQYSLRKNGQKEELL